MNDNFGSLEPKTTGALGSLFIALVIVLAIGIWFLFFYNIAPEKTEAPVIQHPPTPVETPAKVSPFGPGKG